MAAIRLGASLAVCAVVFLALQRLLMPKYATQAFEGNLIAEYYLSAMDHNIIFIGDCEVFAGFSPVALWEELGVASFVRGSPQQLLWHSYYLLRDTLRHETPDLIVLSVLAMQYAEPQSEAYNRLALDGMRLSPYKLRAARASMTEGEALLSYVFPLLRFKERWRELSGEDFRHFFARPRVSVNGFVIRADARPAGWLPAPMPRASLEFGEKPLLYLGRIADLAAARGIPLVLVKAPTLFPHWHGEWDAQIRGFAAARGIHFVNFLDYADSIGLDFSMDTFDGGATLNVFGAEKLTRFFAGWLDENFSLPDRRGEPGTAERWREKGEMQRRTVARQLEELGRNGAIADIVVR